jgi:hypothetical protein
LLHLHDASLVHVGAPGKCRCGMELVPVLKKSPRRRKDNSEREEMSGMPGMSMGEPNKPAGNPSEFVVPVERQQQSGHICRR